MKMTKRILSMLLALALVIGILPTLLPTVAEAAAKDTPKGVRNHLPSTAKDIVYLSEMDYISDNYKLASTHKDYAARYNPETGCFESVANGAWSNGSAIVLGATSA